MKLLEHYPENLSEFYERVGGRQKFEDACSQVEIKKNRLLPNFRVFILPVADTNSERLGFTMFVDPAVKNLDENRTEIILDYYDEDDEFGKRLLYTLKFVGEIDPTDKYTLITDTYRAINHIDDAWATLEFDTEGELDFCDVLCPYFTMVDPRGFLGE